MPRISCVDTSAPRTLSKKRRNHFGLRVVAVLSLFFSGHAPVHALSVQDREVSALYARSIQIVEGRVVGISAVCHDEYCGAKYVVDVSSSRKGPVEAQIEVCGAISLRVGFSYVLFVSIPVQDNIPCRKYIEEDAVFYRMGDEVFRYMSPDTFNVFREDGRKYLTYMRSEEDFDSELDKASSTLSPGPRSAVQNH